MRCKVLHTEDAERDLEDSYTHIAEHDCRQKADSRVTVLFLHLQLDQPQLSVDGSGSERLAKGPGSAGTYSYVRSFGMA
jgi:hypothetical protein